MLLFWIAIGFGFCCIRSIAGVELQGVMFPGKTLSRMRYARQPDHEETDFQSSFKKCAQLTAAAGGVFFQIQRDSILNRNGEAVLDDLRTHCDYTSASTSRTYLGISSPSNLRMAVCYQNCTQLNHFRDMPANSRLINSFDMNNNGLAYHEDITFDHLLQSTRSYISFEQCKELAVDFNSKASTRQAALQIRLIKFKSVTINEAPIYICHGTFDLVGDHMLLSKYAVGVLAPMQFSKFASSGDLYNADNLTNIACNEKDIPYEFSSICQQFSYNYSQNATSNVRRLLDSEVQQAHQATYVAPTGQMERFSLTFHKIAQTNNTIFPANLQSRFQLSTIDIRGFNAVEAVRECAMHSVKQMRRTFNLYLVEKGWKCTGVFEQLMDPGVLSQVDERVLQSYMFSAHINSMRDPDNVIRYHSQGDEAQSRPSKRPKLDLKQ